MGRFARFQEPPCSVSGLTTWLTGPWTFPPRQLIVCPSHRHCSFFSTGICWTIPANRY